MLAVEINAIGGYYAYSQDLIDGVSVCDFDVTNCPFPHSGYWLNRYRGFMTSYETNMTFQIEFGDIGNILAYISIGDRIQDIERLVSCWLISRDSTQRWKRLDSWRTYISPS